MSWLYDPDLDREPQPAERQSALGTGTLCDVIILENSFGALEEVLDPIAVDGPRARDVVMILDGKHRRSVTQPLKFSKKAKDEFHVMQGYKDRPMTEDQCKLITRGSHHHQGLPTLSPQKHDAEWP